MILLVDLALKPDRTLATIVSGNSAEPEFAAMEKGAAKAAKATQTLQAAEKSIMKGASISREAGVSTSAYCSPGCTQTVNP
jgi:hypothetical protein